jgi:hypothetical protein
MPSQSLIYVQQYAINFFDFPGIRFSKKGTWLTPRSIMVPMIVEAAGIVPHSLAYVVPVKCTLETGELRSGQIRSYPR